MELEELIKMFRKATRAKSNRLGLNDDHIELMQIIVPGVINLEQTRNTSEMLALFRAVKDWELMGVETHQSPMTRDGAIERVKQNLDYMCRLADCYLAADDKPLAIVSTVAPPNVLTRRDLLPEQWQIALVAARGPDTVIGPVRQFYRDVVRYNPKLALA
ncbi:MAG: hypothetical protein HY438_03055 [DPANN group archaeon]|nr:hypothetical protein [DPANN group archaeon]